MEAHALVRRISSGAMFWPLWVLAAVLQLADVGSLLLPGADRHIREINPVLLTLEAHYGAVGAALVKALALSAGLALLAGFYLLAQRIRNRFLAALCLVSAAAIAVYSAVVLWHNVAVMLRY